MERTRAHEADSAERTTRLTRRDWVQAAVDWLYGYDYFISYRWNDGRVYAVNLAEQLVKSGYECFLDSSESIKGESWKQVGARALKKTSRLVLIGSPQAVRPDPPHRPEEDPVLRELRLFTEAGKRVVPINFGETLTSSANAGSPMMAFIDRDGLWIREDLSRLAIGPSESTIADLEDSYDLERRARKRERLLRILLAVFAMLAAFALTGAIAALFAWTEAVAQRASAQDRLSRLEVNVGLERERQGDPALGMLHYLRALEAVDEPERRNHRMRLANAQRRFFAPLGDMSAATAKPTLHQAADRSLTVNYRQARIMLGEGTGALHQVDLKVSDPTRVIWAGSALEAHRATLSGDGRYLMYAEAAGVGRYQATIRDLDGESERLLPSSGSPIASVVFGPTFESLGTTSHDRTVRVFTYGSDPRPLLPPLLRPDVVHSAAYAADGKSLILDDESAWSLDLPRPTFLVGDDSASLVEFSRDGSVLAIAPTDGPVRFFDGQTLRPIHVPDMPNETNFSLATCGMAGTFVSAGYGGATIFNSDGALQTTSNIGRAYSAACAPGGNTFAIGTAGGEVFTMRAADGEESEPWTAHDGYVETIAVSDSGGIIVTGGRDGWVRAWSADGRGPLWAHRQIEEEGFDMISHVAISGHGIVAASDESGRTHLYDVKDGGPLGVLVHESASVNRVAFSPDGTLLATAYSDFSSAEPQGGCGIWDVRARNRVVPILEHDGPVIHVDFSRDGRRLFTASVDGTTRVWDTRSGQQVTGPLRHPGVVWFAAFSPDGGRIVTTSSNGRNPVLPHEATRGGAWAWDLPEDPRPIDEIRDYLEALASRRLDANGSAVLLSVEETEERLQRVRARGTPPAFYRGQSALDEPDQWFLDSLDRLRRDDSSAKGKESGRNTAQIKEGASP